MKIHILLLGCTLLLSQTVFSASSRVQVQEGQLTAYFEDAELARGLRQLSSATGVQFMLDDQLSGKLNVSVTNVPVEQGIERVLKSFSHVAYYRAPVSLGARPVLYRVKVFRDGAENSANYQILSGPGAAGSGRTTASTSGGRKAVNLNSESEVVAAAAAGANADQAAEPGNAVREVAQAQQDLAKARHKAIATEQAINAQLAALRRDIATGNGDTQTNLDEIGVLQDQLLRSQQSSAQEIITRQNQLVDATTQLALVDTPQDNINLNKSIKNRQVRSESVTTVPAAATAEAVGGISWLGKGTGRSKRGRRH